MKIVVVGGTGLIGSNVVARLRAEGHDAVAASPATGVNTITGEGLADVLVGAAVVVDVANSPSFEDAAVLEFFETSGRHLLDAEAAAGVSHHVALSVVGADRLPDSGYLRAKVAQEALVKSSGIPYTIVRATQFFEFVGSIVEAATTDDAAARPDGTEGESRRTVRLAPALMQPVAADDVAAAVAEIAGGAPHGGTVELAGPDSVPMDELARQVLAAKGDSREVTTDVHARYFGTEVDDSSLRPAGPSLTGPTHFTDWLAAQKW